MRMRAWRESQKHRMIMTADGPLVVESDEFVIVTVLQRGESVPAALAAMATLATEEPR